jgi:predicted transcriptional regulator
VTDHDVYIPTPAEAAEIEAGIDEIERGDYVTLDEMMREVCAIRTDAARKRTEHRAP